MDPVLPLTETNREELRDYITLAEQQFDALVRRTDPHTRLPGSTWNAQEAVAHVLTVAHRYLAVARGGDFERAPRPGDVAHINERELRSAIAPMPQMADQLMDAEEEMARYFDRVAGSDERFPFHAGITISSTTGQTNWLGELLMHGSDIARAAGTSWDRPVRAMTILCAGLMEVGPAYLRKDLDPALDMAVEFRLPDARPYLLHIHDGRLTARERRTHDRPDAILRVPAPVMVDLLYQRIGSLRATLRGLRVVGGRRPWTSLRLQSCFEPA